MPWGWGGGGLGWAAQLEHEVDTYKADSSAQQKSIAELEQQKRQLADDLQAPPTPPPPRDSLLPVLPEVGIFRWIT
jgi:hypothetical protein